MYKKQPIHFVGIGGVGMSGIAEVLVNLGYVVSGSDLKSSSTTRRLKKKGIRIHAGHRKEQVADSAVVVVSSAIKPNNPEVLEAKARGIPIIQRAEMLAELMRFSKYGIAVSGSHGKTTTTSLIASILYHGGSDPTMIIGGKVNSFRSNARLGKGDFMVAEADESDGSFLKLSPSIVVITGIDREHMDYYRDEGALAMSFLAFAKKVPFYGVAICCKDHPVVEALIPQMDKRVVTYGLGEGCDLRATDIKAHGVKTSYQLWIQGVAHGEVVLNLAGHHNVLNSLASIAVGMEVNIPIPKILEALKKFKGIHRRCEVLFKSDKMTVIDDYGHHPAEIRATLQAVRTAFPGRLVTLFQPHRYTRTKDLFSEFLHAFEDTDVLLLTDVYPAGEAPIEGAMTSDLIAAMDQFRGKNSVFYLPKKKRLVDDVLAHLEPGDVLLTLGAGDVSQLGHDCAKRLKGGYNHASLAGRDFKKVG